MISDLFPFIFDYGNVGHEMWCQVPLMPIVMKFGPTQGMLCEQFCDIESQGEKGSQRSIVGRGHTGHNLGSYEDFTQYVPSHMRPVLFGYYTSFCWIFALKVRGVIIFGHYLKMSIK